MTHHANASPADRHRTRVGANRKQLEDGMAMLVLQYAAGRLTHHEFGDEAQALAERTIQQGTWDRCAAKMERARHG